MFKFEHKQVIVIIITISYIYYLGIKKQTRGLKNTHNYHIIVHYYKVYKYLVIIIGTYINIEFTANGII